MGGHNMNLLRLRVRHVPSCAPGLTDLRLGRQPSAYRSATSTALTLLSSLNSGQMRRQHATANSRSFRSLALLRTDSASESFFRQRIGELSAFQSAKA